MNKKWNKPFAVVGYSESDFTLMFSNFLMDVAGG